MASISRHSMGEKGFNTMNDLDFSGKAVLVVGGSSGIGNGIAQSYRARGAEVHVWGTRAGAADARGARGDGDEHVLGLQQAAHDVEDRGLLHARRGGGAGGEGGGAIMGPDGETPVQSETLTELDEMIDMAKVEGQVKTSALKKVGEIIDKHPDEAVAIVRSWLYQDN